MKTFDGPIFQQAKKLVDLNNDFSDPIPQSVYLLEEMNELSKEVLKDQRHKGNIKRIKEEMADVLCTLLTYSVDKGIDVDELKEFVFIKLKRALSRIEKGER